jgi:peroxiredoxin Q/BCP
MSLRPGDPAPDFDVTSSDGRRLRLSDFRGKKYVVVYFYPKDFTPICTAEACGFRDNYAALQAAGAEVIGVSTDGGDSHGRFAEKHQLPYALVSDPDRQLAQTFGAVGGIRALFGGVKRITYVIDREGKIAGVFDSQLFAGDHVQGARKLIAGLSAAAGA